MDGRVTTNTKSPQECLPTCNVASSLKAQVVKEVFMASEHLHCNCTEVKPMNHILSSTVGRGGKVDGLKTR